MAGPLFSDFSLTLDPGRRIEAIGPFFYSQHIGSEEQIAFPPFFTFARDPDLELSEFSIGYPAIGYRRYGAEYRLQIGQLLNFAGGQSQEDIERRRFTLFPFYFQQRSPDPKFNYTAVVPFYGHLVNRLFRDDIKFVMFPAYSETRKKDVVTDNYMYPVVHVRHGDQLEGWQVWPFIGEEHKGITYRTNAIDEREVIGGYDRKFVLFPFYFKEMAGIGTDNPDDRLAVIPFYARTLSPKRDTLSYGWPLGYTFVDDREAEYKEKSLFWVLYVSAEGPGKSTHRAFPFYSHAYSKTKESSWYAWPIYKFNRIHSPPLDRTRTRICFFLYSEISEKNTDSGEEYRRVDFWPFYTMRRDQSGKERLQVMALLEPFFPNNRTVAREYSSLWSFWVAENNPQTQASSRSLFWNLYRRDQNANSKKLSLLFGLFQYQSTPEGRSWRACYLPAIKKTDGTTAPKP